MDNQQIDEALANESRAWVTITVSSIMLALAALSVALRSYTRIVMLNHFGMDDYAAAISLLLAFACGAAVMTNVRYGLGRHMSTLDNATINSYFKTFYVTIVLYNATLMSAKITFLLQYYRVFTLKKMRIIVLAALCIIGCWCLSQLLVVIFNCSPIHKFWEPETPGTCIPNLPFWYINAAGNIVTDVAIFVLPLPVLSSLKLRKAQKLVLMGIFSLGFFTCAISIIRIKYLHLSPDATFDNVSSAAWSVTEICTAIICACLPTLRPLVSKFVPTLQTLRYGKSNSKGYRQHSYGRDALNSGGTSNRDQDLESSFGAESDKRPPASAHSTRLHAAAGLELQRISSDANLSTCAARPGESRVGHGHSRAVSAPGRARRLGEEPSVTTEIGVADQPTWQEVVSNGRGIGVQRDIFMTESEV